jgi:hypothetical protein
MPVLEAEAILHRLDPVTRELGAVMAGVMTNIYVPSDCDIVLRGERIKLRMVQPGDRLRVSYERRGSSLIARHVEVQPGCPSSLAR